LLGQSGYLLYIMQFILAIILISFLASFIRSAFGFGEALVAVPLLALLLPLSVAVPLALMLSVSIALLILIQDHQHIHLKDAKALILSAIPGIPLGLFLMLQVEGQWTKLLLGLFIAVFALYSLQKPVVKKQPHQKRTVLLILMGFLSGVLGGAYGLNGPPLVFYGDRAGWNATQFRATLQAYFLPASGIALLCFFAKSLVTPIVCYDFLVALPAALPAIYLGRWLNAKLSTRLFFKVVYLLPLLIGILLLFHSLIGKLAW
jgi:uncharacterized membrane protein YfcA